MKAIEILAESKKIDEAPASMLGQIAKRAGAGVLGAMGLNTWAGQINDKADVGMFANRYYKEFQNYLKGRNRSPDRATFGDLKAFMKQQKIPTHNVPGNPSGAASKDMVDSIFKQTAQEVLSGKVPDASAGSSSQSKGQQKQAPAQKVAATQSQPAQQTTPVSAQPAPASGSGSGVKGLLQQISQLSPKDLAKVEKALQAAKGTAPAKPATTQPAATSPADVRKAKQATAAASAQTQMKANPAPAKPVAPTPADTRKAKQATAASTAQTQMKANPALDKPTPAKTPAQTRAEKQATATANAQAQMKANPAPDKPAVEKPAVQQPAPKEKDALGRIEPTLEPEKVIANPVATIGNKRATNIGQKTFDKETGRSLPGQALNNVRKKAEYGSGALGKARKNMQAKKAVAV